MVETNKSNKSNKSNQNRSEIIDINNIELNQIDYISMRIGRIEIDFSNVIKKFEYLGKKWVQGRIIDGELETSAILHLHMQKLLMRRSISISSPRIHLQTTRGGFN